MKLEIAWGKERQTGLGHLMHFELLHVSCLDFVILLGKIFSKTLRYFQFLWWLRCKWATLFTWTFPEHSRDTCGVVGLTASPVSSELFGALLLLLLAMWI